jgi:hypothetical protein
MPAFFSTLLALFLTAILAQLVYWHIVRPVILLKLRYALFEIRDRLRLMMIRKEIGLKQPAYAILEEICNLGLYTIDYTGLTVIMSAPKDRAALLRVQRNVEIIKEAELPLQEIFAEINRVNIGVIICNSPGWIPWIVFSLLCSYWSQKARERIDRWKRDVMGMTYGTT